MEPDIPQSQRIKFLKILSLAFLISACVIFVGSPHPIGVMLAMTCFFLACVTGIFLRMGIILMNGRAISRDWILTLLVFLWLAIVSFVGFIENMYYFMKGAGL